MTEKIIVKREPKQNGGNLVLFFPEGYKSENNWRIPYYASVAFSPEFGYCHGECIYDYFRECKPVNYTSPEVILFVTNYVKYVRNLPNMADYEIKLMKRIQH